MRYSINVLFLSFFLSFSCSCTVDEPHNPVIVSDFKRYEAETANLSGDAAIEAGIFGFSGTGYVNQKNGNITFQVTVSETQKYNLKINYTTVNQRKDNYLIVNNEKLTTLSFGAVSQWTLLPVNKVLLQKGLNTITIEKYWGYTYIDYLEITEISEDITFQLSQSLINPNASPEAINLYNYLKETFGNKVLTGAMANYSTGIEEATWMYQQTGKWPALAGFDFINYTRNWNWVNYSALVNNAKSWWNNNGIVSILWHWRDPSYVTDQYHTDYTSFDISKIENTASKEYSEMIRDIDMVAIYLKQLNDAGVPVLWRPLHEASGKWFWWGAKGASYCKILWRLMHDRLVNYHGLNNLIWVWTSDANADAKVWYPGDDYVDIIGMDIYAGENNHNSQYYSFDRVKEMSEGRKIIALTECGAIPHIDKMFAGGDVWSWIMPWNSRFTRDDAYNGANFFKSLFQNSKVITRDELPNLKSGTAQVSNAANAEMCTIYPNPVKEILQLRFNSKINNKIKMIDSNGKLVFDREVYDTAFNIDMRTLPKGVYYVQINDVVKKVVLL